MVKETINVVGTTPEGKSVVQGAFYFVETHGIPLDMVIEHLENKNMIIDWCDFYEDALKNNWGVRTIFTKIEMALLDLYGRDYAENVLCRLHHYLNVKHKDD